MITTSLCANACGSESAADDEAGVLSQLTQAAAEMTPKLLEALGVRTVVATWYSRG